MPHTHFLIDGERVPIQEALDRALEDWDRESPYTYPMLKAMVERDQRESFTPSKFYGCDRSLYLKMREDYIIDPANAYARMRGSMFHAILEPTAQSNPDLLVEVDLARPIKVDGVWRMLTGRIDLGDPKRGLLTDYKTTKKLYPPYPKPDDVGKMRLYTWMAEAHGITFDKGELVYVEIATGKIERSRLRLRPAAELWIAQRVRDLQQVYEGEIPEVIDIEEQWRCDYCDVREQCELYARMRNEQLPQGAKAARAAAVRKRKAA